jgi:cytochrome c peroxidase
MIRKISIAFLGFILLFGVLSCTKDKIESGMYSDAPYILKSLAPLPPPPLPPDVLLTQEKVKLGKMLFFEKQLSSDETINCASCHDQKSAFSDTDKFSSGVGNAKGKRQSMAIINLAWTERGFFWDGRARHLRDQVLMPIQDPLEMNETLNNVIDKLSDNPKYINQFIRAFGDQEITEERIALSLEQFLFTLVSNQSKYDKYLRGEVKLSDSEERGRALFFEDFNPFFPDDSGADCVHCHEGINFTTTRFMNNGLDSQSDMEDLGRENVTEDPADRGKFKVTTLRNIALTPPYMHDGRFNTLKEVMDHYNTGIKKSPTLDPALKQVAQHNGLKLSEEQINDVIAFLHTLTDEEFINNKEFEEN